MFSIVADLYRALVGDVAKASGDKALLESYAAHTLGEFLARSKKIKPLPWYYDDLISASFDRAMSVLGDSRERVELLVRARDDNAPDDHCADQS